MGRHAASPLSPLRACVRIRVTITFFFCTLLNFSLWHYSWITVINLYLSPSRPLNLQALDTFLSTLAPPFLVVGDCNCRHTLWGDTTITPRGRSLESFLSSSDLVLLNTDRPTRFDTRTQSFSCLDLSLCSPSHQLDFTWTVLDQFLSSDHFPILLSPTSYVPLPNPPPVGAWTGLTGVPLPPFPISLSPLQHFPPLLNS